MKEYLISIFSDGFYLGSLSTLPGFKGILIGRVRCYSSHYSMLP